MRRIQTVYSLPELNGLSKAEKKKAIRACQFMPFKNLKVAFSLSLFFFVPLVSKATSHQIIIFSGINSKLTTIAIKLLVQTIYGLIAVAILLQVYIPVIRLALHNYLSRNNLARQ